MVNRLITFFISFPYLCKVIWVYCYVSTWRWTLLLSSYLYTVISSWRQSAALKCYIITFPLCTCGQIKINSVICRSSQPAEAGFSQRNVDVVMNWGSAEADGLLRQTLDCVNSRGQRARESTEEWAERTGDTSQDDWICCQERDDTSFKVLLLIQNRDILKSN